MSHAILHGLGIGVGFLLVVWWLGSLAEMVFKRRK